MARAPAGRCSFFLAFLVVVSSGALAQDRANLKVGDLAPALRAEAFGQPGPVFDLNDARGTVVVLEFWATWCSPCVASIPHVNDLVDKFAGRRVTFVSITDDEEERLAAFLKTRPMKGVVVRDRTGELFSRFGVVARPYTVVVAPDGRIAGITDPEAVTEQKLAELLANGSAQFEQKELEGENLDWDQDEIEWKDGVKPDLQVIIKPIRIGVTATRYLPGSNRLTADGVPLQVLVLLAYSTDPFHVDWRAPRLKGQYRVSAIVPPGREAALLPLLQAAISAQIGITAVWEDREADVHVLKIAPGAKPPAPSAAEKEESYSMMRGNSHAVKQPISRLVKELTNGLEKIVVDETGLTGKYDWNIPYQPGQPEVMIRALSTLGLELMPARRVVKVLVVR